MAKLNFAQLSFLGGEVSANALGRVDVEKMRFSAQTMLNWLPLATGAMTIRPGLQYIDTTKSSLVAKMIPFIFGQDDTAMLVLTNAVMRVIVSDAYLTVASVSTSVTNGDFSSATGWTLTAGAGATVQITGGALLLNAAAVGSTGLCERSTSVILADRGVVHRLRVVVTRGPVQFQIGSAIGLDDYFAKTSLGSGTHSIAFTPTGAAFVLRFTTLTKRNAEIDSVQVESSGILELPTPWLTADITGPSTLRHAQSGDIIYVWAEGYQQRQIERRDNNSWSVCKFEPEGGPYQDKPDYARLMRVTANNTESTTVLTCTAPFFSTDDLDSIIAIDNVGYNYTQSIAGVFTVMDPIEVQGITTTDRKFTFTISVGTWTTDLVLQRSLLGPDEGFSFPSAAVVTSAGVGSFESGITGTYTAGTGIGTVDDSTNFENVTAWYRWGFTAVAPSGYVSGVATINMTYPAGKRHRGQARIIGFTSTTSVNAEVFQPMLQNDTAYPNGLDFRMAEWSHRFGWPTCGAFHDGRLWHGGRDKIWGSVSDDFTNYDEQFEGEAGPINRSFGYGPFARVNWILGLTRLLIGRESSVESIRSSNFDAPLTPTDFTIKTCSEQGTFPLPAVKIGTRGMFVENSGRRVYELAYNVETNDYDDRDLTVLNSDIGLQGFVAIAAQRQPNTRVHLVRGDGQVAILTYDPKQGVECWSRIETDGGTDAEVEDVAVLPGDIEDSVYYVVKRTINGGTVRYIEKLARLDQCEGATLCRLADSFKSVSQASSTTITGLSHLEGETVVVWANGKDLGDYTVASGSITVSEAVTTAIVGLEYSATWKSAKLAYAARFGSALTQKKKLDSVGLVMANSHYQGLEHSGVSFDRMDFLRKVEGGTSTPDHTVWSEFDAPMLETPGGWSTDARLYLRATAPRPCTVVAAVIGYDTHERV